MQSTAKVRRAKRITEIINRFEADVAALRDATAKELAFLSTPGAMDATADDTINPGSWGKRETK